eukprot:TRINITY_DN23551_c0_g1_i1.p1 TRINITY_DN23551_c0_g1~~TRINITY_DN23551_c0_g1_i1.p1  ORF type:complete len:175 (+),score=45.29 TRINITY_DN23551_c0_g1_i1:510-1034(+)
MKRSRSTLSAIAAGIPVASNRRHGGNNNNSDDEDEDDADEEVSELEKEHARSVIRRQEIRRLQTHYQQTQSSSNNATSLVVGVQQQHPVDGSSCSLLGTGESQTLAMAASTSSVNGGGTNGFVATGARHLARRRSAFVSDITGKEDIDSSSNVAGGGGGTNSCLLYTSPSPRDS